MPITGKKSLCFIQEGHPMSSTGVPTLTTKAPVWFLPKAPDLNRVSEVALEPKGAEGRP